jgi:riboflavin synthase
MFTGIVEDIGQVLEVRRRDEGRGLVLGSGLPTGEIRPGDSVAVDGVCLTATHVAPGRIEADVGPETLTRTSLGLLQAGARVHLERALALGARLGGHLVLGHVDGLGEVLARRARGDSLELELAAPEAVRPFLVSKGSVAVDGVSLTVNEPSGGLFWVTLVPHTLSHTTLGERRPGAKVNLESDILGKYVRHFVSPGAGAGQGVDERLLREHGFLPDGKP